MKQTETNGSQEEGEGRTLSLFNELDPLVFWVLSRSVVLWATTSGRSAVYHSPSGNYFSVRMADWNYQRAGGKSSRPNSPANTNVIQREIYSHFCLLRGSNSCCHTEKRFRPLFTLAAQVTLLMEVAVTTRQLRCFYFLVMAAAHLVLRLVNIQVLSWGESCQSLKIDLSSVSVNEAWQETSAADSEGDLCGGNGGEAFKDQKTLVSLALRCNLKTGTNISWYLEHILYSYWVILETVFAPSKTKANKHTFAAS